MSSSWQKHVVHVCTGVGIPEINKIVFVHVHKIYIYCERNETFLQNSILLVKVHVHVFIININK